ncbi:MAG: OmpH family outer membrane protein [Bacteroidia bacterium]
MKNTLWLTYAWAFSHLACAQTKTEKPLKMGYTNIELVLSYLPEAKDMQAQLNTYERKILEQLNVKQAYLQTRLEEYQELKAQGKITPAQEEERRKELLRLDEEIKKFQQESEESYLKKKEELLKPLVEKLQKTISDIAAQEGYDYILNNSNASGVATILHGPQAHDITGKLLRKLGVNPDSLKEVPSALPRPALSEPKK